MSHDNQRNKSKFWRERTEDTIKQLEVRKDGFYRYYTSAHLNNADTVFS